MYCLLYFLFFYQPIFGSHFDGGSIRWAPIDNNNTTSPVQILITQSYTYTLSSVTCTIGSLLGNTAYGANFSLWCIANCGATSAGYVAPTVLGYCTGSNAGLNLAFVQRTDIVNLTANDYFTISYSIPSTATAGYYRLLALSAGGTDSSAHWNITATIDIRPRTDNGLINTPPIANVISPYGIPYNITTQIIIPTMDVDGDDVRCRWSNSTSECGSVCFPRTIPATTTLSSNCILTITGTTTTGWYCASIQVEDFLNTSTSLQPMSSTPVQFLIYVYMPKNCSVSMLNSPSTCVGVQVGVPYILTYTVINSCGSSSNISDIAVRAFAGIVQGPLVSITPNKTTYEMNVTYTPLASQVGLQILCAAALDNSNIPSNQYCVTFIVGNTVTPICPSAAITTYSAETSTYTEITSMGVETSSLTSTETLQTSVTTTTYDAQTSTYTEITTAEVVTSSLTSSATLQTSATTADQTTTELKLMSTTTTTSASKSAGNNWLLIGSLIGLISLLVILGSCCFCYHFFGSAAAASRRRQQQQEKQHQIHHQPVSEIGTDLITFSRPPKAYRTYDIDVVSRTFSNKTNNYHPRTETNSTTVTNTIRLDTIENSTPGKPSSLLSHPIATKNKDASSELKHETDNLSYTNYSNRNRSRSTISVTRIPNTKRSKSMSDENKIRQPSSSKVFVTRIEK